MGKLPGVPHLNAVRALEKVGFRVLRQGKHIVMTDGQRILTIPRHNPVNAFTMGGIIRDAGLTDRRISQAVVAAYSPPEKTPPQSFRAGSAHTSCSRDFSVISVPLW